MSALLFASKKIPNLLNLPSIHRCITISDRLSVSGSAVSSYDCVKVLHQRLRFTGKDDSHGRRPYIVLRVGMLGSVVHAQHAAKMVIAACDEISQMTFNIPHDHVLETFAKAIEEVTNTSIKGFRVDTGDDATDTGWAVPVAVGPHVFEVSFSGFIDRRAPYYEDTGYSVYSNGCASVYLEPAFRTAVNIFKSNYGDIWKTPAHKVQEILLKVCSAVSDSTNTVGRKWDVEVVDTDEFGRGLNDMLRWDLAQQNEENNNE